MTLQLVPNKSLAGYPFVPLGGSTGQVLGKASAADNDTAWIDQTGGGGLTLPLTQNLTFSPDNTYDVGTNATTARPRTVYVGTSLQIGADVILQRGLANVLEQRNGASSQSFRLYVAYTDATNYERLRFTMATTGATIVTEALGTGTVRNLTLGTTGTAGELRLQTTNAVRWLVNTSGHLLANTDNAVDIGTSATNRPRNLYMASFLQMAYVATPAPSGPNTRRLYPKTDGWYDLDSGGVETRLGGGSGGGSFDGTVLGDLTFVGVGPRLIADLTSSPNNLRLMIQTSVPNGASYLGLKPNGAGTGSAWIAYEQDDTPNSGYGILWADGTQVNVGSGASGSGSPKPLSIWSSGEKWRVETSGHLLASNHNTYDIGDGSHAPRYVYAQSGIISSVVGSLGATPLSLITDNVERWRLTENGHWWPGANQTYSIGSDISRVLAVYTTSLYTQYMQGLGSVSLGFTTSGVTRWLIDGSTGALLGAIDNQYDIGQSNGLRPRKLYVGTGVDSPTVVTSGSLVLQSGASMDFRTGNTDRWRIDSSGHFWAWTDNTYDIGQVGARPRDVRIGRDLFLGRNLTVGGTVTVPNGAIAGAALADGGVTSAKIADGTIATADLANNAVTNAKLGSDTARANLLTNGGFEIWQRGNGPFTASGAHTADRWVMTLAGTDTMSISRDSANAETGSNYCAAATFTLGTGAGASLLNQSNVEFVNQLKGKTVTFSVRVRTSTANGIRLRGNDAGSTGQQFSGFHSGSGAWETLSLTYTVGTNATAASFGLAFNASGTYYVDNAMLVIGEVPADYAPLHPADDLARCERYYEVLGPASSGTLMIRGWAGGPNQDINTSFRFRQTKAVSPTVTKVGTWTTVNNNGVIIPSMSVDGMRMEIKALAVGDTFGYNGGAGAAVTVEANP